MNAKVVTTAYFVMPAAQFISYYELQGNINLKQMYIMPERKNKKLLKEIQNTYEYRKNQIFEGKLEETSGWEKQYVNYETKVEELELLPMDYYENKSEKTITKNGPYPDENIDLLKSRK